MKVKIFLNTSGSSSKYAGACKSPPLSLMHNVLTELAVELCAVLEQSAMNLNKIELF